MNNQPPLIASLIGAIIISFVLLFAYSKWGPAFPLAINQVTTTKTELFSVTGEGKVFTKPDIAQVNLGFTTNGTTVSTVQNQANQTINKISADIKNLGIGESDIQTSNYSLQPNYDYSTSPQRLTGYSINVNIQVKVRDFTKINSVIDTATADGANQVGGLSFTLDDATQTKFEAQARKIAISQAKQKAAEIASETGITLGRIIDVSEGNQPTPRPMIVAAPALGLGGGEKAPTQVEPGSSEIDITVTLSYETR